MKIKHQEVNGGVVELAPEVTTSYNVHPNLCYLWVTMPDGHLVSVFINRENGLVVLDYQHKNGRGGKEFVRQTLDPKSLNFCKHLPKIEEEQS